MKLCPDEGPDWAEQHHAGISAGESIYVVVGLLDLWQYLLSWQSF